MNNGSVVSTGQVHNTLAILPNPSKLLNNIGASIDVYKKVAEQPDIFAVIQGYSDAISGMDFVAEDEWVQGFLSNNKKLARQLIRYAVSARDFGMSIIEVVEYGEFDGKVVPLKLDLSPLEKFHFNGERKLCLKGEGGNSTQVVFDAFPNKFIFLQSESTWANPYGTALLDIAYWLAVGINGNFEFMLQFAEEDGRDKWIGKYAPGSTEDQKNELLNMMYNIRNNGVAAIPQGMEVEPKDYKNRTASQTLYQAVNEMILRKVEKLWFGTDLTMQVDGKGGYSASKVGVGIKEDSLHKGKDLALEAIAQLVGIINAINGSTLSSKCMATLKNETTKEEAEVDKIYFDMGMKPTTQFFKNRGYEEGEFTTEATTTGKNTSTVSDVKNQQFSSNGIAQLEALFEHYRDDLKKK